MGPVQPPGGTGTHPPELFRDFIQVAGIRDEQEARMLLDCGVHYLGFPLRLPVHVEDLSEADAENDRSNYSDVPHPSHPSIHVSQLPRRSGAESGSRRSGLTSARAPTPTPGGLNTAGATEFRSPNGISADT